MCLNNSRSFGAVHSVAVNTTTYLYTRDLASFTGPEVPVHGCVISDAQPSRSGG